MADIKKKKGLPLLDWLFAYRGEWLRFDILAGLTTAAVVIPKAMAYATVAGLPVQVGLYTALVPMVIYALLGTSRPLSVSTTTTLAILAAAGLGEAVPGADPAALLTASATLALLVGAFLVLASALRLGFVANFISESVLVGFKAGIGLVIILDQIPKLLGVHIQKEGFFLDILSTVRAIPETSLPTLALGGVMIVLMVGLEHFLPKSPAPLIAVGLGIASMALLGLGGHGVAAVGQVPSGLPGFTPPDLNLLEKLWPAALGIALMSFTESIAAARAFAKGSEPPLKANRELLALGLANAGGALFGAMPAGGGTSQTAVNRLVGARTQMAELVTAGGTLVTLLFLAPLIALMPMATLAAVVIVYSLGLVQISDFRAILRVRSMEFKWALAAFAGVVLLGTLKGIVVAILVSLLALLKQMTAPAVFELARIPGTTKFRHRSGEHPDDETFPGLLMVRIVDRIFFANAEHVLARARELAEGVEIKVLILDLRAVPDLEYTALKMLVEAEGRLKERGVSLRLVGLNPAVHEVVLRSPLAVALGPGGMHRSLETAVEEYEASRTDGHKS
jgi:high affinity sulfate transporter 1